jgi:hypothetical protein
MPCCVALACFTVLTLLLLWLVWHIDNLFLCVAGFLQDSRWLDAPHLQALAHLASSDPARLGELHVVVWLCTAARVQSRDVCCQLLGERQLNDVLLYGDRLTGIKQARWGPVEGEG